MKNARLSEIRYRTRYRTKPSWLLIIVAHQYRVSGELLSIAQEETNTHIPSQREVRRIIRYPIPILLPPAPPLAKTLSRMLSQVSDKTKQTAAIAVSAHHEKEKP